MALRPILDTPEIEQLVGDPTSLLEAAAVVRKTIAVMPLMEQMRGQDVTELARPYRNSADVLLAVNWLEDAEPVYRRSLELLEQGKKRSSPELVPVLNNLAVLLEITDRREEARALLLRARGILDANRQGQSTHARTVAGNLLHIGEQASLPTGQDGPGGTKADRQGPRTGPSWRILVAAGVLACAAAVVILMIR